MVILEGSILDPSGRYVDLSDNMPNTMSTCGGPKGNQGTYSCVMWGGGYMGSALDPRYTESLRSEYCQNRSPG